MRNSTEVQVSLLLSRSRVELARARRQAKTPEDHRYIDGVQATIPTVIRQLAKDIENGEPWIKR